PLTYRPRVEQPRVLPRKDLLGDAQERIGGLHDKVVVTQRLSGAILRLRSGVLDHFLGGRAGGEGPNRGCRLRASSEQSSGAGGDKGGANHLSHSGSPQCRAAL